MSASEYVIGIVSASVAVSLIKLLFSDDKGGVKKTLSYILALAMVCAVMLPLGGLLSDFLDGIENGKYNVDVSEGEQGSLSDLIDEAEKVSEAELAAVLARRTEEHFSLPEGSVEVRVTLDFGKSVTITSLTVYLSGRAMWEDPREIKAFIYELTEFECEVVT